MAEEALLENQVTYLYHASAKKLYNLALYSIVDQPLAEQLSIDAFVSTFHHLKDKSDATQFRIESTRRLHLMSKRALILRSLRSITEPDPLEIIKSVNGTENIRIQQLFCGLNYDERFLLLLLLQQEFSQKQIAQILCIPIFIVKKRIYNMLNRAMDIWSKPMYSLASDEKPE
ncbi:MAG: hypothetical protein VB064_14500 [Oscillospiraceae bacterium]|nr:hypothetical protein [Oscillospiraceae bacterium]